MANCADLGTEPDVFEQRLHNTLLRGANWKSMILFEDADAIVYSRDMYQLRRSAIVSIFLRHIEYSEGIHFITTSNDCNIDPAIRSRAHLALGLPRLTFDAQEWIWLNFIGRISTELLANKAELDSFIKHDLRNLHQRDHGAMNGRQIRNCVDAALALARVEGGATLRPGHIKRILDLGKEFRSFLGTTDRWSGYPLPYEPQNGRTERT